MKCSSIAKTGGALASVAVGAVLACTCLVPAQPAYAVTSAEKAAEAQEVLNELYAMQDTMKEASNRYMIALSDYAQAIEKRDAAQKRIDEITAEITDIQGRLGNRARDMYRSGSSSFIDMLLGAASFDEFTQSWDLLNRVNESDAQLSQQAKELREEVEAKKAEYNEQANVAEQKSIEAQKAYDEAAEIAAQMEETYNTLSAEAQELYEQEQAAAAAAAAAAAQAAAEAAAAEAAAAQEAAIAEAQATGGGYTNDDGSVTDANTGQTYKSASEYTEATGNAVVDRARSMLGHSYSWGGTGADGSFDCSGLVGYALTGSTTRIGTTTTFMGWNRVSASDAQPGDVVTSAGHAGIYIGNGRMIHASDYGTGVVESDVQKDMIYVRQ